MTEVRFKNQGLDSIEVQDNGDGISPHNYKTLALKHHTSKLSTYDDLTTLQTFGFRGEALSSLCALSKFSVVTCMASDAPKGTKLDFEVSGKLKGTSVVAAQKGTTVSVENLFNNLPVRRRELERNIKREWNRVTGVLGQYACIQTAIKFSVTQQAGKGKKTTIFSTKGNQTTRENIVNVFGAKTLTALVPMDLNLELEPTSGPNQRRSTQEDGGKKDIRIVGHISRPASGEGRQTPDRQMFFVNSRPCGLPQVAKAFNEVYKSYNASQSPFIFANIELDTHMYDVNVSPDKRTILLHDQTRMLENLKVALTELFESQDYTVPISQLSAQKQPSYKQLTISRENTTVSKTPDTPQHRTESAEREESEVSSKRSERAQSEDGSVKSAGSGESAKPYNPGLRRGAVSRESRESMSRDQRSLSLITNWLGRRAEDRIDKEAQPPTAGNEAGEGLSKEKRRLVEKFGKESEQAKVADDSPETLESSVVTTQATGGPQLPRPVADFNHRMAELQRPNESIEEESDAAETEESIPALSSPAKPPSSIAERFSVSARSQRPPPEIATITIGDHTVTSSIGTPCPKRPRIESPIRTPRTSVRSEASRTLLPSFGSRLSQRFAAPGTTLPPAPSEEESEDENQDPPTSPQLLESPPLFVEAIEGEGEEDVEVTQSTATVVKEEIGDSSMFDHGLEVDDAYIEEAEKKAQEEAKVQEMIKAAEENAAIPSNENMMRAKSLLKGGARKKDSTFDLLQVLNTSTAKIGEQLRTLSEILSSYHESGASKAEDEALDSEKAEEKLSLTISKADFAKMKVIGQFNLGFILASRASEPNSEDDSVNSDDLLIIDQHASDEKYNFERLQATTVVQSQRLVYPKTLDLTALEEEIVIENLSALETNGFILTVDESGESPVGRRCQVVALPLSRETTFSLEDLDELLALLAEAPSGSVPRPSKVRKMFAMRACRSSIMIGRTLTHKQMGKVLKHLGELDKPWNCPHGRPTMRHLCSLGTWDDLGWKEGEQLDAGWQKTKGTTDWAGYVRRSREASAEDSASPRGHD